MTFGPLWDPEPPDTHSETTVWNFDGHFFNDGSNSVPSMSFPSCSSNYFVNSILLTNETTTAWWVSGGPNFPGNIVYTANLDMELTFANGQQVQMGSNGKFNMFRPSASITPIMSSVNIMTDEVAGHKLIFADPEIQAQGIVFSNSISLPPIFIGNAIWAQIVQSRVRKIEDPFDTWHISTMAEPGPYLDTSWPWYVFLPDHPTYPSDSPFVPLFDNYGYIRAEASNNFNMYMFFQPPGGMWVPLRVVNWSWSGTAETNPSVHKTSESHNVNSIQETENYPFWKNNVTDAIWIPTVP